MPWDILTWEGWEGFLAHSPAIPISNLLKMLSSYYSTLTDDARG